MRNPDVKQPGRRLAWTVFGVFCFIAAGLSAVQGVILTGIVSVMHQTYQMSWWILAVAWLIAGMVALKR